MKNFLKIYTKNNSYWNHAANNVIDSDFDEADVNEQIELDEMFNLSHQTSEDFGFENDKRKLFEAYNDEELDSDDDEPISSSL